MKKTLKPTLKWEDAPDTIGVDELKAILGVGAKAASDIFNQKGFPLIAGAGLKADKEAAKMFLRGFKIKDNPKIAIDYMILQQLEKVNMYLEKNLEEVKQ